MSRIQKCLTAATGVAAGLFLGALASSASANADSVPINPGLPSVVEQVVASSTVLPQQLLQTTASALGANALSPAATPAQAPIATATFNVPPTQNAVTSNSPAALPGMPALSDLPGNLGSVFPIPMPNFGGTTPVTAAPTSMVPGSFAPAAPAAPAAPVTAVASPELLLLPGLP